MAGRAKRSRFPFLLLLPGSMTANLALPVGILSNRVGCFVVGVMVVVVVLLLLLLGVSASCGVAAPAANGCGDFEWRNLKSRPLGASDGHVAQFVSNLERQANAGKTGKKRLKPRPEDDLQVPVGDMHMESSYMSRSEELSSTDVTLENSDYETEATDSTLLSSSKYSSMHVFVRRKQSEL